jgi:Xaa-Pro aminopeptidase
MNQRLLRLHALLSELEIDAALITSSANIRYLTGFTGSNGMLLLTVKSDTFYTDPRYTTQAAQETVSAGVKVKIGKGHLLNLPLEDLGKSRIKRLAVENQTIPFSYITAMQPKLPLGAELVGLNGTVDQLRAIKDDDEMQAIRASVKTCSAAFERAIKRFRPHMLESELALEIDYQMRKLGASGPAFETIVASGERSALPHARPSRQPIREGQLLLIDMGASQEGYASDMTRMLHVGEASRQASKLHRAVLESQLAALEAIKAGVTAHKVDQAARKVLKQHGLEKAFVHSLGHGLGLEIHEYPRIGKRSSDRPAAVVLEENMAITVEPGAYVPGFGGVRIEDTVLVTKGGVEILTPTSKELRVL